MFSFMAGATVIGHVAARTMAVRRSFAMPALILAKVLAVAGATIMASAFVASSICSMPLLLCGARVSDKTGCPLKACMVSSVMNDFAASVIITCTSAPCFFRALTK